MTTDNEEKTTNTHALLSKLKMTLTGVAAAVSLASTAQTPKAKQALPEQKTLLMPENREVSISQQELAQAQNNAAAQSVAKTGSAFDKLQELPYGLMNQKEAYVMSLNDWQQNGEIKIKRVDKNQIANHDLVSVMEAREGRQGDVVNKNPSGSRMFMFQSTPAMGKNFVRYLYCSDNEALHNFAAKYVCPVNPTTKQYSQQAAETAKKYMYDENGELKTGLHGTLDRQKAIKEMNKIHTKGINKKGVEGKYSDEFIRDFTNLSKTHYNDVLNAQKEFIVGFYPLIGARTNQVVNGIEQLAKRKGCRDGSCVKLGDAGKVLASKIAFGANSDKLLNEKNVVNKADSVNKTDYVTLDAARQMAICGVTGADEMYDGFRQKVDDYQCKMNDYVKEQTTPDLTQKQDAIKDYHREADRQDNQQSRTFNSQQFQQILLRHSKSGR